MKDASYEKFLGALALIICLPLFVLIAISVAQGTRQLVAPSPHPRVLLPVPLETKTYQSDIPGRPVMDIGLYRVEGELLAISDGRSEQKVFLIRRPSLDDALSELFETEVHAYRAVRSRRIDAGISLAAGIVGLFITGIGLRIGWAGWFGRRRPGGLASAILKSNLRR